MQISIEMEGKSCDRLVVYVALGECHQRRLMLQGFPYHFPDPFLDRSEAGVLQVTGNAGPDRVQVHVGYGGQQCCNVQQDLGLEAAQVPEPLHKPGKVGVSN